MGFGTEGFLGTDAQRLADEQRSTFADLFDYAFECSATAMKIATLPLPTGNKGISLGVMFCRCLAQYQGAIILAERGLPIESMVLTRALYETNLVLGALAANAVTPEELVDSDFGNRTKIGAVLLPIAKKHSPTKHHAKLAAFIANNTTAKPLSFHELAQRSGMQMLYDGLYRHLSHFAAHPSITAAEGYFVPIAGGEDRVIFRPLTNGTPKAILSACSGIMVACAAFEKAARTNLEVNAEIAMRLDREEILYEKYRPWDIKGEKD